MPASVHSAPDPLKGASMSSEEVSQAQTIEGVVKWYCVKAGYGFIRRQDTGADVFVHRLGIAVPASRRFRRSLGEGEKVEFHLHHTPKGPEAKDVTGPGGAAVQGSAFARRHPTSRRRRSLDPRCHGGVETIVSMCIATAKAFCGGDKKAMIVLLPEIFEKNRLPHLVIPWSFARDARSTLRQERRAPKQQPLHPRQTPRKRLQLSAPLNRANSSLTTAPNPPSDTANEVATTPPPHPPSATEEERAPSPVPSTQDVDVPPPPSPTPLADEISTADDDIPPESKKKKKKKGKKQRRSPLVVMETDQPTSPSPASLSSTMTQDVLAQLPPLPDSLRSYLESLSHEELLAQQDRYAEENFADVVDAVFRYNAGILHEQHKACLLTASQTHPEVVAAITFIVTALMKATARRCLHLTTLLGS